MAWVDFHYNLPNRNLIDINSFYIFPKVFITPSAFYTYSLY